MNTQIRQSHTWLTLGILMILLYIGCYFFANAISEAEMYAEGISYIEYLNSSTQRVVKLELQGSPNEELVYHLENIMEELDSDDIYDESTFHVVEEIDALIADVKSDWDSISEEIEVVRDGGDTDKLLFASERFYNTATELTIVTTEKFTEVSKLISSIQIFIMILVGLISIIIFRHLYHLYLVLKHTRELAERMFIDVSTGLYNRSKCQELLKSLYTPAISKSRIMIVVDLNDLKITNDRLGHQVGDMLIANFARILKKSSEIHDFDIFVGRYGGDEFLIYYDSAEEKDAQLYLAEVNYLIEEFNREESRFVISYAVGYAVFDKDKDALTIQELFSAADEAMYQNKVAMKAAKRMQEELESSSQGRWTI